MAFREVTVIEIKEVLRQWIAGVGKKKIAARVGLDPKTVRRYVRAGETSGLTVGYQLVSFLTASAEVHYQRWFSTPASVRLAAAGREQATYGGGLRANIPLSDSILMRPGISYFRAFDAPMTTTNYQIVQIDLPIAF